MLNKLKKKKGNRESFDRKAQIAKVLEIPSDAFVGDAVVTLVGKNEILIGNYKGIICYKEDYLKVLTNKGAIEVIGSDFHISYLTKEELKVVGNIKDINY